MLSIAINPLLFSAVEPIARWWEQRSLDTGRPLPPPNPMAELPMQTDTRLLTDHVVVVGWGRVGKRIPVRYLRGNARRGLRSSRTAKRGSPGLSPGLRPRVDAGKARRSLKPVTLAG